MLTRSAIKAPPAGAPPAGRNVTTDPPDPRVCHHRLFPADADALVDLLVFSRQVCLFTAFMALVSVFFFDVERFSSLCGCFRVLMELPEGSLSENQSVSNKRVLWRCAQTHQVTRPDQ